MKKFSRFIALATLAAFLGLSALEAFHSHTALDSDAHCAVCQIAHQTPALLNAGSAVGPHWISVVAREQVPAVACIQFVSVTHGLSPPIV